MGVLELWGKASGTPQVVCTPGLCVHSHKCSLCRLVKWAVGVRPCAGTVEGPKQDKESWLTGNLQPTGENYERRQQLLIKIERKRKGPTVLCCELPFHRGEEFSEVMLEGKDEL